MTWYEVVYTRADGREGSPEQFSRRASALAVARFNIGKPPGASRIIRARVRRVSQFRRLRPDGKLYQVETVLEVNA